MATIRDVAKAAGVSIGSVSRYLNGYTLKKENMTKIQAAINHLNFEQNYLAKGLKTKKSHAIGVVVNALTDVFAASIVTPLEYYLEAHDYELIMCDYKDNLNILKEKLNFLCSRNIDGIVIFHLQQTIPILQHFQEKQIPIVAIDTPIAGFVCDAVLTDNYQASANVVTKLYQAGHQNIGIIAGNTQDYVGAKRLQGYVDTTQKLQIFQPNFVASGNHFKVSSYDATLRLLRQNPQISALYTTNYYLTLGAVQAINELDLKIPDDISFVGFDDYALSEVLKPQLTVVAQPVQEMGEKTGKLILNRINQPDSAPYHSHILKTHLVWRDSVIAKK